VTNPLISSHRVGRRGEQTAQTYDKGCYQRLAVSNGLGTRAVTRVTDKLFALCYSMVING
jgi:hypothetical protein